jgi:drug/metabolite transporter (DMT)-like permease
VNKLVIAGVAVIFIGIAFLVSGDLGYYEHNLAIGELEASQCSRYMTSIGCPQPPAYIPPIPYDKIGIGVALVLAGAVLATANWFKRSILDRIIKS